jgi:succinoglycan biosynthesis transport protein ExoP
MNGPSRDLTVEVRRGGVAFPPDRYIDARLDDSGNDMSASGVLQYWRMLMRHKLALFLAIVLGGAAGFLSMVFQPVLYTSRLTLEMQGFNEQFMNMNQVDPQAGEDNYSASQANIATQCRILESQSLKNRVLTKLERETLPPTPILSGFIANLRNRLHVAETEPLKLMQEASTTAATTLTARGFGMTRIIELRCESNNPDIAAAFLNTLANEYVDQSLEARLKNTQRIGRWLSTQVQDVKAKLEQSENRLQDFMRSSGAAFVGQQETLSDAKLARLQGDLASIQADRISKQARYETAKNSPLTDSLPDSNDDAALRPYRDKLTDLRRELAQLTAYLTPEHYKVKRLQAEITEVEGALQKERANALARLRSEYDAALRREKLLAGAYSSQTQVMTSQADKMVQLNILRRDVDINRQLYNALLQQVNQANIASALPASGVRVIDPAIPATLPSKPDPILNIGLGLLSGLILGCLFVFLREHSDQRVRAPGQLSTDLNLPELGVIPSVNAKTERHFFRGLTGKKKKAALSLNGGNGGGSEEQYGQDLMMSDSASPVAESFRATLASILFERGDQPGPHVITVSSPSAGEGKSTVTSNMAIAMAETNRRVLLIDADLRRARQHKIFGLNNAWGLTNVIQDSVPIESYELEKLATPTSIPRLWLLPSGPPVDNITGLLYSHRLLELIRRVGREFDYVLIDTPPLLAFADARVLGRITDGIILVLRSGVTDRSAAWAARNRLTDDGATVLGLILNDWNPPDHDSYYSHYYQSSAAEK